MMLVDTQNLCGSADMNTFLYIAKNVIKLIMIIAPILAIISITILLFLLMNRPDDNKLIKKIGNSVKALVIIFFIP